MTHSKLNRNDLCYCNSGKKYKKCCINKQDQYRNYATSDFSPSFLGTEGKELTWVRKYSLKSLLPALSVIQLQLFNHGKDIRIEHVVTQALRENVINETTLDLQKLRTDLLSCDKHIYEDPPEDFFTENILFANGNNIVYPGTFVQAQQIVQAQLDALHILRAKYPVEIHTIFEDVYFMLHLHNKIAHAMGHERRMYKESRNEKLHVPALNDWKRWIRLFSYSEADLINLCREISVPEDTYSHFVLSGDYSKIKFDNPDEHPLFEKPFVLIEDQYILAMPIAQLPAINHFIVRMSAEKNLLSAFTHAYATQSKITSDAVAKRMKWEKVADLKSAEQAEPDGTILAVSLHQFDADKAAMMVNIVYPPNSIVERVTEQQKANDGYWKEIAKIVKDFKKLNNDIQVLLVIISDRSNIFGSRIMTMPEQKQFDLVIGMSMHELQVLPVRWDFNQLSLWKYARDREASHDAVQFGPYSSHLSMYKYYEGNHFSFFHPDHTPYDLVSIDFDVPGTINRLAKNKLDKIGIEYPAESGLLSVSAIKKEEYLPIYLSEEYLHGKIRQCLLVYVCPIWVQSNTLGHPTAEVYVNAILFWLLTANKLLDRFFSAFGELPIVLVLVVDEDLYDKSKWELGDADADLKLDYLVKAQTRSVEITLPVRIINQFAQEGNGGELLLMVNIIEAFSALGKALGIQEKLLQSDILSTLEEVISPGLRKMILIKEVDFNDPVIADIDVSHPRYIDDGDISNVLQSQLKLLDCKHPIPKIITDNKQKGDLLNALVSLHFKRVTSMIAEYEAVPFLLFLMNRHEDLLQAREMRKISLPTMDACYGEYYDVFAEYRNIEGKTVSTSLAIRTLIEFVACEMPTGTKKASNESVDIILAHILELINYGAHSDSIKYEIENPKMGLLDSGRLGIDFGNSDRWLHAFRDDLYLEEFNKYKADFPQQFRQRQTTKKSKKGDNIYYDKVDEIFEKEWGITVWNLIGMCSFLCWELFERKVSVGILSEEQIRKAFAEKSDPPQKEIDAFLKLLTFIPRKGILNLDKNKLHEAFPWRYNRSISYMLKPLIPIVQEGKNSYIISARHLFTSGENILARFMEGTLKVDEHQKGIQKLLAERNHIKGEEFRDAVCNWLKTNTRMEVFDFEVKIKPKGFFNAAEDKGDVDILCINRSKKIIYSIECKNTSQAKIAYDIFIEIRNYIGIEDKKGMIDKHVRRHQWLIENIESVKTKLSLSGNYEVQSFVLTKHIIPTRYLHKVEIPVYSYSDLQLKKVF